MEKRNISQQALQRLPLYLNYLRTLSTEHFPNISATIIAEALGLNDVQVRKDLAAISSGGRPKIGYKTESLITDIEKFLGYGSVNHAVLVGAGNLGRALISYHGFSKYGLDIIAAFDVDTALVGEYISGKPILPLSQLKDTCERDKVQIGIIAVPAEMAQVVCDQLIRSGILAIWNFAPVHLNVPEDVLVQNENMAFSLAILSQHLAKKLYETN